MLKPGDIAIVSGVRTPFGRYCGKLKDFSAQELGAIAAKAQSVIAAEYRGQFDHAIFGNAQQTSGDALYGARHVGLRAGLPIETPALTVNRLCGSGMQSIVNAAQMIQLDEAKIVLAGGMEAMSQAPFVIRGRDGFTLAPGGKLEDSLMVALLDTYCGLYMANTAELYGEQQGITRQAQDEFALRSQQRADAAYKEGRIQEELVPVPLRSHKGEAPGESLAEDDHRRPQTTMEGLAKLKLHGRSGGQPRADRRHTAGQARRGDDVVGAGVETRPEAAGTDLRMGHCGSRAEIDGARAGAGDENCAAEGGPVARLHRSDRSE